MKLFKKNKKYECPCCGYYTFDQKTPGTFEICKVCFWQDDIVQYKDIYLVGGPNKVSLFVARQNYKNYGASEKKWISYVRKPNKNELPKNN